MVPEVLNKIVISYSVSEGVCKCLPAAPADPPAPAAPAAPAAPGGPGGPTEPVNGQTSRTKSIVITLKKR